MVGFTFSVNGDVHPSWQQKLGLDGPDDVVVRFNPSCDCGGGWGGGEGEPRSWDNFANTFNMQSTKEGRLAMFERFKAGKPTHEAD